MPWRGDSLKASGGGSLDGVRVSPPPATASANSGDLTSCTQVHEGGYFDGGDHCKFMLPQAYAIARLAWFAQAFPQALAQGSFDVRCCSACTWVGHALCQRLLVELS